MPKQVEERKPSVVPDEWVKLSNFCGVCAKITKQPHQRYKKRRLNFFCSSLHQNDHGGGEHEQEKAFKY